MFPYLLKLKSKQNHMGFKALKKLLMRYDMKKLFRITSIFFTIFKLSAATFGSNQDPYLSNEIIGSVNNISISKLLDFKKIASALKDDFDKARFHYIISYEINERLLSLDEKFNNKEKEYLRVIRRYENELS